MIVTRASTTSSLRSISGLSSRSLSLGSSSAIDRRSEILSRRIDRQRTSISTARELSSSRVRSALAERDNTVAGTQSSVSSYAYAQSSGGSARAVASSFSSGGSASSAAVAIAGGSGTIGNQGGGGQSAGGGNDTGSTAGGNGQSSAGGASAGAQNSAGGSASAGGQGGGQQGSTQQPPPADPGQVADGFKRLTKAVDQHASQNAYRMLGENVKAEKGDKGEGYNGLTKAVNKRAGEKAYKVLNKAVDG